MTQAVYCPFCGSRELVITRSKLTTCIDCRMRFTFWSVRQLRARPTNKRRRAVTIDQSPK